jgi:hypothetical protein
LVAVTSLKPDNSVRVGEILIHAIQDHLVIILLDSDHIIGSRHQDIEVKIIQVGVVGVYLGLVVAKKNLDIFISGLKFANYLIGHRFVVSVASYAKENQIVTRHIFDKRI